MPGRVEGRICVIGAGVAGVATAAALQTYGFDFVVYEKQQGLGGLWYNNYPGAAVQTTAAQYEYPGQKYPEHIRTRKMPPAPTADEVKDYLKTWCENYDITGKFEFGVEITRVSKNEKNNSWTVESSKGSETFGYVIICSGLFSNTPNMLDIPGLEEFKKAGGVVEHSSTWTSLEDFKRKRVMVIGNGKSAADAAVAACKMAKAYDTPAPIQCVRKQNWYVPRFLLQFYWAFHSRVVSALLPRYFEHDEPWQIVMHCILYPLKWFLWRVLEVITLVLLQIPYKIWPKFGTLDKEGALSVPLLVTDDRHIVPVRKGDIDMRICQVAKLEPGKAHLTTGETVEIDMLVMGTGWKLDYGFLDEATVRSKLDLGADGLWCYRNILPPQIDGIAFVGSNCLTFMNTYTAYVQAFWLVELLSGDRDWPVEKVMTMSIAKEKAFKRKFYPMCPIRAASVEAYMQHYHDLLFLDQGIEPLVYSGHGPISWFQNACFAILPETMAEPYRKKLAALKKTS